CFLVLVLVVLTTALVAKTIGSLGGGLFAATRLGAELDAQSRECQEKLRRKLEVASRVRSGELGLDEATRQFQELGPVGSADSVHGNILYWVGELTRGQPDRDRVLRRLERERDAARPRHGAPAAGPHAAAD